MRHTFLVLAASALLALFTGCACNNCCNRCNSNAGKAAAAPQQPAQQAGPGGAVSYPYYTMRGPRDFLETHPQSIGP
ncbi:MAG: hypothetical protein ACLP9L_27160 [Thermoguttaceae bacterium]